MSRSGFTGPIQPPGLPESLPDAVVTVPGDAPEVLSEWIERFVVGMATVREEKLRAIVQPKPRWLPERLWRRILGRLLYLEITVSR